MREIFILSTHKFVFPQTRLRGSFYLIAEV